MGAAMNADHNSGKQRNQQTKSHSDRKAPNRAVTEHEQ